MGQLGALGPIGPNPMRNIEPRLGECLGQFAKFLGLLATYYRGGEVNGSGALAHVSAVGIVTLPPVLDECLGHFGMLVSRWGLLAGMARQCCLSIQPRFWAIQVFSPPAYHCAGAGFVGCLGAKVRSNPKPKSFGGGMAHVGGSNSFPGVRGSTPEKDLTTQKRAGDREQNSSHNPFMDSKGWQQGQHHP